ncbi:hypothetical protein G7Y89_g11254 [Cudoniella acicularis]|uniref:Uncharacterized protein n=1 Tax=Cudoniella acicularis TaxID=354080 RepID=A0A8H4VY76_9HELO|nr:hypothetical protein G7Y89_g11254 [Cudoniella acicularis]
MAPAGPSADPGMGGQYQSEPGMGDTTGKKKRARAAPRQPKVGDLCERPRKETDDMRKGPKNPGENMFSAVNPQIIQPQTREQQLPSPGLPSEPFQAIQPKEREPSVEAKEVAPNEPHPASQELQEPPKEPREEPKPAEPNPPPNA